ncbi:hypothetical protein CDAR_558431 [Caerostris darwini]|uniref:Uncharacterized protein n=1 Tax=Caerostris darwini TaxID=1538125 RepID=A0AAV4UP79_9ARAC|nr:hypothetical protein CDAR_558431 [Caerostris darwini]
MEETAQRDRIIKAKIDLIKGMELLKQGALSLYQMSLPSGKQLAETFGGNNVFDTTFARLVRHIENLEYLLLFVHARMTDATYKPENEEAMIYPWTQNDVLKIRADFVQHRDGIFFWAKILKDRISNEN